MDSKTHYEIRINGRFVIHIDQFDQYAIDEFAKACKDNPEDYVDIVMVRKEVLMNQFSYHQMKKHFKDQPK